MSQEEPSAAGDAAGEADAHRRPAPRRGGGTGGAAEPVAIADVPQTPLKDLLVNDLLERLALANEDVQISFEPGDEATLNLTSPRQTFEIDSAARASSGRSRGTSSSSRTRASGR